MPAAIIPVADADDPRIAPYRAVRERDMAGRADHLIAEGEVVLRTLAGPNSRARPASLLIAANRLSKLADLIAALPADAPVYAASQRVMDAIVGFPIHRGVLALARRPPDPGAAALLRSLPDRALVIGLFGIGNHDNMGGIFRNAAAFGADAVLLDSASCDPLYRKAIRVSVGAALCVPFARLGKAETMLALLEDAGFDALALTPGGAPALASFHRPARAAVLFGAEGPGLPPDVIARAKPVSIPMAAGWDSLNVAAASAVVLHALSG